MFCGNVLEFKPVCILILCVIVQLDAHRVFSTNGERTILCMKNETIKIECNVDIPMAYCSVVHPSGKKYSLNLIKLWLRKVQLERPESSSGQVWADDDEVNVQNQDLNAGQCALEIKATEGDNGQWRCHMGRIPAGIELIQHTVVKVVDKIAAVKENVTAVHGESVTLYCASVDRLPLTYCRFEPPKGAPFSIDGEVEESKPLLNKYYYPANKSLDRGDCAVTILKAKYQDVGQWTCGAGFGDGNEYSDQIIVSVEGLYTMSTASVTSVTIGVVAILLLLILLGYVAWKKRQMLGVAGQQQPESIEVAERVQVPAEVPQGSPSTRRVIPSVVVQSPSDPVSVPLVAGQQS